MSESIPSQSKMIIRRMLIVSRFVGSDVVSLQTKDSTHSYKIHRALLESKSDPLKAAFGKQFQEGQQNCYTFEETSEGTLVRFIEWAYRGDYLNEADDFLDPEIPVLEPHDIIKYHPLVQLQLYIFSQTYLIPELEQLAFLKLCVWLTSIGRTRETKVNTAVISVLRLAFQETIICEEDKLLEWLAAYAAYYLDRFRKEFTSEGLFKVVPKLARLMITYLKPASFFPEVPEYPVSIKDYVEKVSE